MPVSAAHRSSLRPRLIAAGLSLLIATAAWQAFAETAEIPAAKIDAGGLDHAMMDETTPPCENFFHFACGGWVAGNPIPADESSWGVAEQLGERNREKLRAILEKAVAQPTPDTKRIGDYYAACMDEAKVESLGIAPLKPVFDRIEGLNDKDALSALIADLHLSGINALFDFGAGQDEKDAESEVAIADQGGMGLPDRDYYLKTDPESVAIRQEYARHIARMLALTGQDKARAEQDAKTVIAIETRLAQGALDRVSRRDPKKTYHMMDRAQLDALTPGYEWGAYLQGVGAASLKRLDIAEPRFLHTVADLIRETSLDDFKTYLKWRVLTDSASWLAKAYVDENFAFFGKRLTGETEIKPRWKRCVSAVDEALGEDLGRAYVGEAFPPEARARTQAMVDAITGAFEADLRTVDWMGDDTRSKALTKLAEMHKKIGYPDRWRDYGALTVARDQLLDNTARAVAFELKRELGKIGKPVDRGEWAMTPPTVNAYYDPQMNDINLPAGILQPPFFSAHYDDPVNFGATGGSTVGHEMTHGFDDEGRQYDEKGNLAEWWTKQDAARFKQRAQCVVDQYSGYKSVGDLHLNGKLTLGENVADLGGIRLGYTALMTALAGKPPPPVGGYTPTQRYFIGYAQSWCEAVRPEAARLRALTDPHSPPEFRVNGVVANMPEFRAAFACKPDAPMVRAKVCRVW